MINNGQQRMSQNWPKFNKCHKNGSNYYWYVVGSKKTHNHKLRNKKPDSVVFLTLVLPKQSPKLLKFLKLLSSNKGLYMVDPSSVRFGGWVMGLVILQEESIRMNKFSQKG